MYVEVEAVELGAGGEEETLGLGELVEEAELEVGLSDERATLRGRPHMQPQ